jgi:flagellar protein FliO/FliZ
MTPGYGSLLGFAAVIALIPLALWLLKRTPVGGAAAHGVLRVVAMLPISTNQRLLAVEVGSGEQRRWLVLGVSPAGIHTLHTMEPPADAPAGAAVPAAPFAQWLSRLQSPAGAASAPAPGSNDAR